MAYDPNALHPHPNASHMNPFQPPMNPMSSHAIHPAQYAYPPMYPHYQPQPQPVSSFEGLSDTILQKVTEALTPILSAHQDASIIRMDALSEAVRDAREKTNAQVAKVSQTVEAAHKMQMNAMKKVAGHVERLEKIVGTTAAEGPSIVERLEAMEFTIGEILERAKDPEALSSPVVRHEAGTSPMKQPRLVIKLRANAGTDPITPKKTLPPPPRIRHDTGTSPMKTLQPPRPKMPMPAPNAAHISTFEADTTSPGIAGSSETSLSTSSRPGAVRAGTRVDNLNDDSHTVSSPAATWVTAPSEMSAEEPMDTDGPSGPQASEPSREHTPARGLHDIEVRAAIDIQSHFSSSLDSFTPYSLSSVDWSKSTPVDAPSTISPITGPPLFKPQDSYKLLIQRDISPDGTVAALRRSVLGDSLGPLDPVLTTAAPTMAVASLPSPPSTHMTLSTSPELDLDMDIESSEAGPSYVNDAQTARHERLVPLEIAAESKVESLEASSSHIVPAVKHEPSVSVRTSRSSSLSSLSSLEDDDEEEEVAVAAPPKKSRRTSTRLQTNLSSSASSVLGSNARSTKKRKSTASPALSEHVTKRPRERLRKRGSFKTNKDDTLGVEWPARTGEVGDFERTFVQCDKCDQLYHYGCVGIVLGDARLCSDSTELFVCPPCKASDEGVRRHNPRADSSLCGRPGCFHPNEEVGGEYVVEKLVGRKERKEQGRKGFLWLIKWEGYAETTWTPEEDMGYFVKLADEFYDAAAREGLDLKDDSQTLLLQEAGGASRF